MKTKIVCAALLFAAFVTQSFTLADEGNKTIACKKIDIGHFSKIIISHDITVVLVPAATGSKVQVTGDEKFIDSVIVINEPDELSVSMKKGVRNKDLIIYIPVANISMIDIGANASVTAESPICCPLLSIQVQEGAKVDIRNYGEVNIKGKGCEFVSSN